MRYHAPGEKGADGVTARFVRDRTTWVAYVMLAYFGYLESALGPLMSFLGAELHFSYSIIGLHFSAFAAGTMVAGLLSDRVLRRVGPRMAFWGGAAGMGVGAIALVVGRDISLTLGGVAVMGLLGTLLLVTLQAVLSDHHGPRRAIALAEANIGASIGGSVAALGLGLWQQSGVGWRAAILLALLIPAAAQNAGAASARIGLSSGIALFVAPLTVGGLADHVGIRVAYSIVPALLTVAPIATVLMLMLARHSLYRAYA